MKFLPFNEAKQFVHKLGLKTQLEWGKYCKSGKKPIIIPTHPERIYGSEWKGIGDWLGTCRIANQNRECLPFEEAKQYVQGLRLKNIQEWRNYLKSGNIPNHVPTHPDRVYKEMWKGFGDWLGTGRIANQDLKYRTFDEARTFVRHLKLKSRNEWEEFCKSGRKPKDIPYQVRQTYLENWKGWGDWLGTGTISSRNRTYRAFQEARQFVRSLKLNSGGEWEQYCKSGKKPDDIPTVPYVIYQKEWKGLGDWLGTGRIANQNREYLRFEEAKSFVHGLGLKNLEDWRKYAKSENKPKDIPTNPHNVYKLEWKSFGDWLGTGTVASQKKKFLPFEDARKLVRSLGLKSQDEWEQYLKSGKRPSNIPADPSHVYPNEWNGIPGWLGYEGVTWSVKKVKELLRHLIKSKFYINGTRLFYILFYLEKVYLI